ncbi:MAG: nucleotidyl transferase AbiEii/AbiGii toxin family protein [Bacteroidales bacterium]|nr:nucleotidyl transferase AbiEii/AbiGii toxin family protein [Bacteroidales bacterium]MBN2764406.1 nucleotidyl transferase AbiEii/AbiGii toxin family protein [Bacteroidales bacterium]
MLHQKTVDESTIRLIKALQAKEYLKDFVLVGGTALSLFYDTRISLDIDLFSQKGFNTDSLLKKLEQDFQFELDYMEDNTLKGSVNNIKVDILTHQYNMIEEPVCIDGIHIASVKDICAMKINAISLDGTRVKDFIDIYFLLDKFSVDAMLGFFEKKYLLQNSFHALKSLTYFDDVDLNDWPEIVKEKNLQWKEVKNKIEKAVDRYIRSLE